MPSQRSQCSAQQSFSISHSATKVGVEKGEYNNRMIQKAPHHAPLPSELWNWNISVLWYGDADETLNCMRSLEFKR